MSKAFFIDTSRCTACRGCQIACKEWKELPANPTKQRGSHQNPPDLNPNNYKVVRFSEYLEDNRIHWNFFPDQCRHCLEPPCKAEADNYEEGAVVQDTATGAVVFTDKTRKISGEGFESMRSACPYDIPRRDPATGLISKCNMCHERVVRGLLPACVKACPTGAMNFGERADMLFLAEQRLADLRKDYPKAMLADPEDVSVIFLLVDAPENYHENSVAHRFQPPMDRKIFLSMLGRPLRRSVGAILKL